MKELFSQQNREMSKETKEKSEIAKKFIEQKYQKNFQEEKMKKEYYDKLISQMQKMSLNEQDLNVIINDLNLKHLRQKRQKESILDYQSLAIIGRGAFGEVRLCRHTTGEIVAIKKMSKREMNEKKQLNHIRAERDILVSSDARWIVELKSSFTDSKNLYLVMEYLPGGDLMNLLIEKNVFPEPLARFYMAEAILAVESVHKLNYIHRDLKPDNILIGSDGHIKLTDFGLCKPYQLHIKNFDSPSLGLEHRPAQKLTKREKVYSMVGTVDYIAPEVFTNDGYTETVDWWSLGTILFEMLMGYPPFYGENPTATCRKVMNFEKHFEIPPEIEVSQEAIDLLYRLITRPENRLGKNGVAEIKKHAFFRGVDWEGIRDQKAPFIPKLSGNTDTSNFDKFEETTKWHEEYKQGEGGQRRRKRDYFWIGYSYKRPYNYEVEKDLKNIFENLKKKKETQKKRMFSEEKIAAFNKKSLSKKFKKEKKKFEVRQKYGFNFIKKKTQQQEVIEENKEKADFSSKQPAQIFQSYQNSEQKNAFVKKLKKKDKKKTKLSEKKDKIFKKPNKNKVSGLRLLKQPQSSLLDSQDSKSKIRKISSKLQKPSFKHLNGVFLPKTTLKNPYSFGLKPELAVLKSNKKVLKLKQESKKLQLLNYKHVLRIRVQTRRNRYSQKLHVRLQSSTRVSQKVRFRRQPKNALMQASKCESITRGKCSSKRPSMLKTSTALLNNSSFEYNFFIMNIFAFYLALQYIKIIGDFANKPDAFDDPSILQQLEREVSDNPIEHQGFLTQVYNEQVKIADQLQFEFEKIQKQSLIQKYSEKGLIGEQKQQLGAKDQAANLQQGVKSKQQVDKKNLEKSGQKGQAEQAKLQDQGQKSNSSGQKSESKPNSVQDNKIEQNSNQQKEQVQQNNFNNSQTKNQNIDQQKENLQNTDQTKHLKRDYQQNKIHSHFHEKNKVHLIDQKQENQNLLSNSKDPQTQQKQGEIKQKLSPQKLLQQPTQKDEQKKSKKQAAVKQKKAPKKKGLENSEQTDFTEQTKNALRKATDVVVKIIALIFIITTLIFYVLMLVFGRQIILQEINNGIANGYTEFIEKQQEVKLLQKEMKDLLEILHWRSIGSQKDDNFLFYNEQGVYNTLEYPGQRYLFNITLPINSTFTLIKIPKQDPNIKTNKKKNEPEVKPKEERSILTLEDADLYCVKKGPQFLYFEIQVDYLHDKTDFVIGFTSKKFIKQAKGDYIPGVTDVSFGFRVKTGEVLNNGNVVYTFNMLEEILDVYSMDDSKNFDFNGSFFGIGISINTKEFFFSYNGRILNSLSFQTAGEIRFQIFNKKRKDELETDFYLHKQEKINKVAKALKLDKNYREEIKKTPIFKSKLSSYVPVIYVNGIRGYPLQLKERQIRTGLLKKGILND